jgi:fucose permease
VTGEVTEPNLAGRAGLMIAAYVGMGLPTAALGVAWPSIRAEVGRPLSSLGLLIVAFTAGYLISTTGHGWVGRQLGTGTLLVVASGLAALGAAAFAVTSTWVVLMVAAAVLGVSGGVIDAALNAHVALYHSGRMMNLMHGGFGVGATLGPLVMTALIGAGLSWRWGYGALALLQLGLVVAFGTTLRHWPAARSGPRRDGHVAGPMPAAAWLGPLVFLAYGAVEVGIGAWAFVLLTGRGIGPTAAGVCVTLYWGALAAGRLGLGALGARVTPRQVVAGSLAGVAVGSVALWLLPAPAAPVALVALGASLAGIFPALTALTPARVGAERAPAVIGRQLAAAMVGGAVGSAVIGVLAQHLGPTAIAPAVVAVSLGLVATDILLTVAST